MASPASGPKKKATGASFSSASKKGNGGMVFPGPKNPKSSKGPEIRIPSPNPRASKAGMGVDDRILRTMPITETQLKGIKKQYGIK